MSEYSFPIRQVTRYQSRTPNGVKTIYVHEQVGNHRVTEEINQDDKDIVARPEFSDSIVYEGVTEVLVQFSSHQVTPHPLNFTIEGASDLQSAFDLFDQSAEQAAEEFKKEAQEELRKQQNQIMTPNELSGGGKQVSE